MRKVLYFDKTLSGLAGNPFGRETFNAQVLSDTKNLPDSEQITIVFPNNIERLARSFIQGFFFKDMEEIGYEGTRSKYHIEFENDKMTENVVWENLRG